MQVISWGMQNLKKDITSKICKYFLQIFLQTFHANFLMNKKYNGFWKVDKNLEKDIC